MFLNNLKKYNSNNKSLGKCRLTQKTFDFRQNTSNKINFCISRKSKTELKYIKNQC